jgi:antagonist of KipI
MGVIEIIKPGMLTTIQDLGRWGFQARGVPVAGPMDPCAHRVANALVGNSVEAATLEVTLLGPELAFDDERVVAIAGAEFAATLEGSDVPQGAPFLVKRGARLRFGRRISGARAYVGVSGGIATPSVLGSRATHLISAMGGINGRALKTGDRLPLGRHDPAVARHPVARGLNPVARGFSRATDNPTATRLRVLPGPQLEYFSAGSLDLLQSAPYVISNKSDRMGFRLEGPILVHSRGADIISDATPLGVLQVPASGQPILLMADRQTTGGYPRIAEVASVDLPLIAQLKPADRLRFRFISIEDAQRLYAERERDLSQARLGIALRHPART